MERPMGNIQSEQTVFCGLCDNYEKQNVDTKRIMIQIIRQRGWKFDKVHGWVCLDCNTQQPKEQGE